jgi:hypothetical protein
MEEASEDEREPEASTSAPAPKSSMNAKAQQPDPFLPAERVPE